MRRMVLVWMACLLLATTGCVEVEEVVTLDRNLSGTASLSFSADMEPAAAFMAQLMREMQGKEGKPTQEEIDMVRQEVLAPQKDSINKMPTKEEIEKDLPPGVKLLESKGLDEGLKFGGDLKVAFDHFDKLQQLEVKKKTGDADEAESASAKLGFPEKPFGGLHLKDEGATLLLTGQGFEPPANTSAPSLDEAAPEMAAALKKIKLVIKITAPFEVVEHNATRKEDKTLIWEYDYKTLMNRTPEQMREGIQARFKK